MASAGSAEPECEGAGLSRAELYQVIRELQQRVSRLEIQVSGLLAAQGSRGDPDSDSQSGISDISISCIWGSPNTLATLWSFCDAGLAEGNWAEAWLWRRRKLNLVASRGTK